MAKLILEVKDNIIVATVDGTITSDTVEVPCAVTFSDEWTPYGKTVFFYQNPRNMHGVVVAQQSAEIHVPAEAVVTNGWLYVGAWGSYTDDEGLHRKAAVITKVAVAKGSYSKDALPDPPTPSEYEQIISLMMAYMDARELTEQSTQNASRAEAAAESAAADAAETKQALDAVTVLAEDTETRAEEAQANADKAEAEAMKAAKSAEEVAESASKMQELETKVSRIEKRMSNVEHGMPLAPFVTDDSVALTKNVPTNALPYAEIKEIGGCSRKSKNLFQPFNSSAQTYDGITMQYLEDEDCFVFNGTLNDGSAAEFISPHSFNIRANTKYYLKVWHISGSAENFEYISKFVGHLRSDGSRYNWICAILGDSASAEADGTLSYDVAGFTWFYMQGKSDAQATYTDFKIRVALVEGEPISEYEPYFEGIRSAPVTEVRSVGKNLVDVDTCKIPDAVLALPGYGQGNPDNAEEYNRVDLSEGKYHHAGDITDGAWVALASPETIDIPSVDNYVKVEGGGTVTAVNEYGFKVPSTVIYQTKEDEG